MIIEINILVVVLWSFIALGIGMHFGHKMHFESRKIRLKEKRMNKSKVYPESSSA